MAVVAYLHCNNDVLMTFLLNRARLLVIVLQ
jgi:hypothetical protein